MAATVRRFDEHDLGLSWVVDEPMRRAAHALRHEGGVWLVEPVDAGDALERAAALGEPAGVVQLLDRHARDCAQVARRLGVPHLRLPDGVPGSPFEVVTVLDLPRWRERALWWPDRRALVAADVVGTSGFYRPKEVDAGMHLFLRAFPPGALRGYEPEHLLVGHGAPVHGPAAAQALRDAYARARRDLPGMVVGLAKQLRP